MADKTYWNELYDFYEDLLTPRQKELLNYYYRDDLSFGEISENLDISKSAISDLINRCKLILSNYEDKLKLVKKHHLRLDLAGDDLELQRKLWEIEETD